MILTLISRLFKKEVIINVKNIGVTTSKTDKMKSYKECEVRLFSKVAGHRYEFTISEIEEIFRYVHNTDATKAPLHIENRDHSNLSLLLSGNMNGIHFKISADGEPIISHVFSSRELRYLLKEVEYLVKHEKVNF